MSSKSPEQDKKERLLAALDQGMTMVHLDARRPGVLVPVHLKEEHHLLLNLSYRFEPHDLAVSDWGIRSTLTFSSKKFTVAIPWSAIYGVASHVTKDFWMYPEDLPPELVDRLTTKVPTALACATPVDDIEGGPRVVEASAPAENAPEGEKPEDETPKPKGRGHLRVVK
jgi:stringent starvation protein B